MKSQAAVALARVGQEDPVGSEEVHTAGPSASDLQVLAVPMRVTEARERERRAAGQSIHVCRRREDVGRHGQLRCA